jgi:hypothetical protein
MLLNNFSANIEAGPDLPVNEVLEFNYTGKMQAAISILFLLRIKKLPYKY